MKNCIKWSEIVWTMLPDIVLKSKLLKKILSIGVFDFSGTLAVWSITGVKK